MPHLKNVGEKVRKIRESLNLSQEELANRSKLSIDLIARIEDSKDMPFLAPLIRIARTLGVRLSSILDVTSQPGPIISRKETGKIGLGFLHKDSQDPSNMSFHPLASEKAGRHMEPFIIDIEPVIDSEFLLSSHKGEEFIYVLSGEIELTYGKEKYNISAGDSIYYDSIVSHHVHTANAEQARILAVVYSPY